MELISNFNGTLEDEAKWYYDNWCTPPSGSVPLKFDDKIIGSCDVAYESGSMMCHGIIDDEYVVKINSLLQQDIGVSSRKKGLFGIRPVNEYNES